MKMMKRGFLVLLCLFTGFLFAEEMNDLLPKSKKEAKTGDNTSIIVVECNVPSAEVYLNSVYQGKTKLTVKKLLPAQYILEVRKSGYQKQKYYITSKKDYSLTFRIDLQPEEEPEIEPEVESAVES